MLVGLLGFVGARHTERSIAGVLVVFRRSVGIVGGDVGGSCKALLTILRNVGHLGILRKHQNL